MYYTFYPPVVLRLIIFLALKETIANVLKINKEPKMSTVMYEDLPEINGFDSVNNANIEVSINVLYNEYLVKIL